MQGKNANMSNINPGDPIPGGWKAKVIGPGLFVEKEPRCPGGGTYTYATDNVMPAVGTLGITCSLCGAPDNHVPENYSDW